MIEHEVGVTTKWLKIPEMRVALKGLKRIGSKTLFSEQEHQTYLFMYSDCGGMQLITYVL